MALLFLSLVCGIDSKSHLNVEFQPICNPRIRIYRSDLILMA